MILILSAGGMVWLHTRHHIVLPPKKIVEIQTLKEQKFEQIIRLLGIIHSQHTAHMISKVSGTLDILISGGQVVKKGMLIAKIDNPDLENKVVLAKRTAHITQTQLDRLLPLLKKGYVSSREVEEKKKVLLAVQQTLSQAKIERDQLRFYAPFDGILGVYKKREGAQVNQGELIVTLYDPLALVVDVDIPCRHLSHRRAHQPVYVLGQRYVLNHVQYMLDEATHMCPAEVAIRCNDCLIGSTVAVGLVVTEKPLAIVIPFQAFFLKEGKPFVYVVERGQVQLLPIKIGARQKALLHVVAGLKPKQQLIIQDQEYLYPGMLVETYQR